MLCEMQSVSSRIWTRVAVSISYDDNHDTTGTWYVAKRDGFLKDFYWIFFFLWRVINSLEYIRQMV